mgnify:CR=1 FL=1
MNNKTTNIVIDARWIFKEISGIGNYTRQLIKHLAQIDFVNNYVILFNDLDILQRTVMETEFDKNPNFRSCLFPYGVFSPINQILLPYHLKNINCGIYHSTNYMMPLLAFPLTKKKRRQHCIVTIHDVIPLLFPKAAPKSRKARLFPIYCFLMRQIARRTDLIITDSDASRADIIRTLSISPSESSKVRTVYCGVSPSFSSREKKLPQFSASNHARLLYVGRMDPYKNVVGLIKIFHKACQICNFPLELTIAGSVDPRYPEAPALVKKLGLDHLIKWTGYLADDQLTQIYQESDLLVHPSRYEGFGLQIVEAMASGLPVVCSNTSSLPEVAEDAAVLLSPDDEDGFALNIKNILSNSAKWEEMRRKGIQRAKLFSWNKTAEIMKNIYTELLEQNSIS